MNNWPLLVTVILPESALESFKAQTWKHKNCILVSDTVSVDQAVEQARGECCIVWSAGWQYHPECVRIHVENTSPYQSSEIRPADSEVPVSRAFLKRSRKVPRSRMTVKKIGAVGMVSRASDKQTAPSSFYHSGNLGDIIYSMAFVQMVGKGTVYLGPEMNIVPAPLVREPMTRKLFDTIAPLLNSQSYVVETIFSESVVPRVSYDLNLFRMHSKPPHNLVESVFEAFNAATSTCFDPEKPWLSVKSLENYEVVINRTHRWRNPTFPWNKVLQRYRGKIVFIGFHDEYASFCQDFEEVPYIETADLLQAAEIIAGCRLFVGNQSCLYAIAEGLKVNTVQETCLAIPNCLFERSNAIYGFNKHTYLPPLQSLSRKQTKRSWKFWPSKTRVDTDRKQRDYISDLTAALAVYEDGVGTSQMLPSILNQSPWPVAYFTFPEEVKTVHFNPAVFLLDGRKKLMTRRGRLDDKNRWTSDLCLWALDDSFSVTDQEVILLPFRYPNEQWDDPRVLVNGNEVFVSTCNWVLDKPYPAHQTTIVFDKDFAHKQFIEVAYGKNAKLETGSGMEKNWIWFNQDDTWYVIYQTRPHIVLRLASDFTVAETLTTDKTNKFWRHGRPSGGTPPILIGDEYFSFFHSSTAWHGAQRRYHMGAYAFSAKAPFEITRMSSLPILSGSEDDPRRYRGPCVVFPCGAVFNGSSWTVSFGVNDEACAHITIPHADLVHTLKIL